ncbi:large ribosomal subunit nuclear export factor, putative [Plasmodium vivax]|uniref:Large ribosomal subunit nuclear export factor, putative n=1 Tax=Plasmodium vivax TaxID=5855 RepID=A0A564ZZC5_PLAVI|nr:large ribosomal subunit nuclear export factor, putative [Plasmodium vivax]
MNKKVHDMDKSKGQKKLQKDVRSSDFKKTGKIFKYEKNDLKKRSFGVNKNWKSKINNTYGREEKKGSSKRFNSNNHGTGNYSSGGGRNSTPPMNNRKPVCDFENLVDDVVENKISLKKTDEQFIANLKKLYSVNHVWFSLKKNLEHIVSKYVLKKGKKNLQYDNVNFYLRKMRRRQRKRGKTTENENQNENQNEEEAPGSENDEQKYHQLAKNQHNKMLLLTPEDMIFQLDEEAKEISLNSKMWKSKIKQLLKKKISANEEKKNAANANEDDFAEKSRTIDYCDVPVCLRRLYELGNEYKDSGNYGVGGNNASSGGSPSSYHHRGGKIKLKLLLKRKVNMSSVYNLLYDIGLNLMCEYYKIYVEKYSEDEEKIHLEIIHNKSNIFTDRINNMVVLFKKNPLVYILYVKILLDYYKMREDVFIRKSILECLKHVFMFILPSESLETLEENNRAVVNYILNVLFNRFNFKDYNFSSFYFFLNSLLYIYALENFTKKLYLQYIFILKNAMYSSIPSIFFVSANNIKEFCLKKRENKFANLNILLEGYLSITKGNPLLLNILKRLITMENMQHYIVFYLFEEVLSNLRCCVEKIMQSLKNGDRENVLNEKLKNEIVNMNRSLFILYKIKSNSFNDITENIIYFATYIFEMFSKNVFELFDKRNILLKEWSIDKMSYIKYTSVEGESCESGKAPKDDSKCAAGGNLREDQPVYGICQVAPHNLSRTGQLEKRAPTNGEFSTKEEESNWSNGSTTKLVGVPSNSQSAHSDNSSAIGASTRETNVISGEEFREGSEDPLGGGDQMGKEVQNGAPNGASNGTQVAAQTAAQTAAHCGPPNRPPRGGKHPERPKKTADDGSFHKHCLYGYLSKTILKVLSSILVNNIYFIIYNRCILLKNQSSSGGGSEKAAEEKYLHSLNILSLLKIIKSVESYKIKINFLTIMFLLLYSSNQIDDNIYCYFYSILRNSNYYESDHTYNFYGLLTVLILTDRNLIRNVSFIKRIFQHSIHSKEPWTQLFSLMMIRYLVLKKNILMKFLFNDENSLFAQNLDNAKNAYLVKFHKYHKGEKNPTVNDEMFLYNKSVNNPLDSNSILTHFYEFYNFSSLLNDNFMNVLFEFRNITIFNYNFIQMNKFSVYKSGLANKTFLRSSPLLGEPGRASGPTVSGGAASEDKLDANEGGAFEKNPPEGKNADEKAPLQNGNDDDDDDDIVINVKTNRQWRNTQMSGTANGLVPSVRAPIPPPPIMNETTINNKAGNWSQLSAKQRPPEPPPSVHDSSFTYPYAYRYETKDVINILDKLSLEYKSAQEQVNMLNIFNNFMHDSCINEKREKNEPVKTQGMFKLMKNPYQKYFYDILNAYNNNSFKKFKDKYQVRRKKRVDDVSGARGTSEEDDDSTGSVLDEEQEEDEFLDDYINKNFDVGRDLDDDVFLPDQMKQKKKRKKSEQDNFSKDKNFKNISKKKKEQQADAPTDDVMEFSDFAKLKRKKKKKGD